MRKLLALSIFFIPSLNARDVIDLTAPDLSAENIVRYATGIRPCRSSGIRLEAETIHNKLIIHDYGHGGSGISLSWGCAQEAVHIMQRITSECTPIAIIGAGVIGLTTAHILKDQGYNVTVYSREFVPNTTSNKAAGVWSPHFGSTMQDKEQAARIKKISKTMFYKLATEQNTEFKGILLLPRFTHAVQFAPTDKLPPKHVVVRINDIEKVCKEKLTLVFDLNLYLQDLFENAQKKEIKFEHKNLESLDELMMLPETIIFNCTGLGSRELFGDTALYPVKGHIIVFKAQPHINYAICNSHQKKDIFFSIIPWQTQLVVGGTLEVGIEDLSVDETIVQRLLECAHTFFSPSKKST